MQTSTKTYIASAAFATIGMGSTAFSAVLTPLSREFGISLATASTLVVLQYACFISCALLMPVLLRRIGQRGILLGGCFIQILGLLLCGMAPSWPLALTAAVPLGLGFGLCGTTMNIYVSELNPNRRGWALGLANFAYGLGALSSPFLAATLLAGNRPWRILFVFDAGLVLVALLLLWLALRGDRAVGPTLPFPLRMPAPTNTLPLWKELYVWVLAIVQSLFMAVQTGLTAWIAPYITRDLGAAPALATLGGTTLWVGITLGRLGSSFIGERFGYLRTLLVSMVLGTALLGSLLLLASPVLAIAGATLVGLAFGPGFPMILALAGRQLRERTSLATGSILAAGGVGAAIGPWLAGQIAGEQRQVLAMLTLFGYGLALAVVVGSLAVAGRLRQRVVPNSQQS